MLQLMAYLGINKTLGERIVSIIDSVGWAIIAMSLIATILSAGGIALTTATLNYVVLTVQSYLKRNAWAKAVLW